MIVFLGIWRGIRKLNSKSVGLIHLLINPRPLKDVEQVKQKIYKIILSQKHNSPYDLSPFKKEIDDLLAHVTDFNPDWKRLPVVFRIAKVKTAKHNTAIKYHDENISLPDVPHDLDLIIKMLNHMREQRKLKSVELPLFFQPSDIIFNNSAGAEKHEEFDASCDIEIQCQMCVGFQKGAVMFVGFVFGRDYVILES